MMKYCGRNSKPTELVRVIREEREKEAAGHDEEEETKEVAHHTPTGGGMSDSSTSVDGSDNGEESCWLDDNKSRSSNG
jgi:heterodisulfide reductase subunit C